MAKELQARCLFFVNLKIIENLLHGTNTTNVRTKLLSARDIVRDFLHGFKNVDVIVI